MTAFSCATRAASRCAGTRAPNASRWRTIRAGAPRHGRRVHAARRARRGQLLSSSPNAISIRRYAPEAWPRRSAFAPNDHGASPPNSPMPPSRRQITLDIPGPIGPGVDTKDDRPSRLDACHARDLGPFERLPDLPRPASSADALGCIDTPGAGATSRHFRGPIRPMSEAGGGEARPGEPLARTRARLPPWAGGSAGGEATASRGASTRPIAGRRRSPRMA